MGFQYLPLKNIQDRFDEAVSRELDVHGAKKNYDKLPQARRKQINLIRNVLTDLELNGAAEFSESEIKKIATGIVRLQKIMISDIEYSGFFTKMFVSADNSLMFRENDHIIGVDETNKIDLHEKECLMAVRNYLLLKNKLNKAVDPNVLAIKEVLDFIQTKMPTPNATEINKVAAHLKQPPAEKRYTMTDVCKELKDFHKGAKLKPTVSLDLKTKFLLEIENFKIESMRHVETVEKLPNIRFKFFKDPRAYMSNEERAQANKALENAQHKEPHRPTTPAVRKR